MGIGQALKGAGLKEFHASNRRVIHWATEPFPIRLAA
jgi:hypothetical protein